MTFMMFAVFCCCFSYWAQLSDVGPALEGALTSAIDPQADVPEEETFEEDFMSEGEIEEALAKLARACSASSTPELYEEETADDGRPDGRPAEAKWGHGQKGGNRGTSKTGYRSNPNAPYK